MTDTELYKPYIQQTSEHTNNSYNINRAMYNDRTISQIVSTSHFEKKIVWWRLKLCFATESRPKRP